MNSKRFRELVTEAIDQLPDFFRERMDNVVVVIEDRQPGDGSDRDRLLMGLFEGIPTTEASVWDMGLPARITLFKDNIVAVCRSDAEVREEVRLTVLHELGHYFGMDEDQLEDV